MSKQIIPLNQFFNVHDALELDKFFSDSAAFITRIEQITDHSEASKIRHELMPEMLDVMVNSKYFSELLEGFKIEIIQRWVNLSLLVDALLNMYIKEYGEEAQGVTEFYQTRK